ncbi:MAG: FAD-dependent oxidoreductase [Anaerolineales bacterium]|nr:MAG: FAD-dependent oxidoreductase [Anaerolineales bacterium]
MKTINETVDVVVAGGGTAGHIAAIQAARLGVKTSVIEAGTMLGGTMTAGGVNMPNHFFSKTAPVVQGIPWELYTKSKVVEGLPIPDYRKRRPVESPGYYSYINVPVYASIAEQEALDAGVNLHYHEFISEVKADGNWWEITSHGRGIRRVTRVKEIIDCSGDSDVVRMLGLKTLKSKVSQPGTLEYKLEGIEHEQIWKEEVQTIYEEAMRDGVLQKGDWAYANMEPFQYYLQHGGHNATHIYDADTSDADGQTRANIEGRKRMMRMFKFVRESIPGGERATLKMMAPFALARETYHTVGEYLITKEDFFKATDFEDKVCNAFNYVDLHSQDMGCEVEFIEGEELLPKVPFRALIPKDSNRITVAGRNISANRIAFAGIRAQCICMAMGQAMGAAAAMAVQRGVFSRELNSKDIVAVTVEHCAVRI